MIVDTLVKELGLKKSQVENAINLLDEGNTVPFIARYRKEMTGAMTDTQLRELSDRLTYLRNLEERKEDIIRLIDEQGKLTDELEKNINSAKTLQEAEDLYAPFKQKKRTRATMAKERGLEPLSLMILLGGYKNIEEEAKRYLSEEVETPEDAIDGAKDIIAEIMSDEAKIRKYIRDDIMKNGVIHSQAKNEEDSVYRMYYDFSQNIKDIVPHRILAINRGEKEDYLSVKLELDDEKYLKYISNMYKTDKNSISHEIIDDVALDSYKRLIHPSIEREIRNSLTEVAQERAIQVFGQNLEGLLMQPALHAKTVMGYDPGYRTGCKIAVVDQNGKFLDFATIYPTEPKNEIEKSEKILLGLIDKYDVDVIAIGNGTASRESEKFIAEMIPKANRTLHYAIVSEAGASVYSASKLANEEHPDVDVSIRGAISIARRLQDPMAELVKIEPKSIGVGQYQHDVNKKRLEEVLMGAVEDSVNKVGVDLNTASPSLLKYVSGINQSIAKNIVEYREEKGGFKSKEELKKVKRLGPQAFKLSSGFFRVPESQNPLDNTGVHPEVYKECRSMFEKLGITEEDFGDEKKIMDKYKHYGEKKLAEDTNIGEITLRDIISEISKPGRDIRDAGEKTILRSDVLSFDDIEVGMELKGTVRNIVDFGAFVDIGIKNDGLVHISKMSKKFVKNPMDIVNVGDVVTVYVVEKDEKRGRVSLSMVN